MNDRPCLIIDDIERALALMTAHGRAMVGDACHSIRCAVLSYAARRQWTVVPYEAYARWASDIMLGADLQWLVLDPLFPAHALTNRAHSLRLSRGPAGLVVSDPGVINDQVAAAGGKAVGIVDDAAASGTTIRFAANLLSRAGGRLDLALLCASTRSARDTFRTAVRGARWMEYAPADDWRILHLRDSCAYLPFAGRSSGLRALHAPTGEQIEIRFPTQSMSASPWRVLVMDPAISEAVLALRSQLPRSMTSQLGRQALVSDLGMLGVGVAAVADPGQPVTADTPLVSLATLSE